MPTIGRVALDVPLAQWFDFALPDALATDVGRLAVVPFGSKKMVGIIVSIADTTDVPPERLKQAVAVWRDMPAFGDELMSLIGFCENYYHAPFGQIAINVIPPRLRNPEQPDPGSNNTKLRQTARSTLHQILITDTGRAAIAALPARRVAQRAMLEFLRGGAVAETVLRQRHTRAGATLATLLDRAWVKIETIVPSDAANVSGGQHVIAPGPAGPLLNAEQQVAVDAITASNRRYTGFVLEGITGSGKTEVYLRAIADTLARQQQALVLVPEINLTPAFLKHVAGRFPHHRIAPAHSGMTAVTRLNAWRDAQDGRADIVVGTRLAVFTPMPQLGLIIVDEEHDQSYKQQEGVRYSARDVAVFRASQIGCPIVLGSATPSIETLDNVARGRFTRLALTARAVENAVLPTVEFIHLDSEKAPDGLTGSLLRAIDETVKRGEQAMVFINRRGFAPALVCGSCAWMPECKRCSARMVFHRAANKMKCHHCGAESRAPTTCGDCGSTDLHPAGQGSERIEAALQAALPNARITRVDRDATRRRGSAEKIFTAAANGEIDVLVGTQMLTKGHDFPKLTLVCVVNADGAVFSADFRAAERLAQQMVQVAGRSGRADAPGRVLIQTRFPEHPVYQAVASHNYNQFVEVALAERRVMHLPPYSYLALLRAESRDITKLDDFLTQAQQSGRTIVAGMAGATNGADNAIRIWEPVASTLERKAGYTRKQLMVQADRRGGLQQFLAAWIAVIRDGDKRNVKWVIDVDPIEV